MAKAKKKYGAASKRFYSRLKKGKVVKHPGSFTAWANKHHMSVHEAAEKEKHAKGKLGKRARLALVFERMHKK